MSQNENSACKNAPCNDCAPSETPLAIENGPNRKELEHRVGTHSSFKATMLRQMSQGKVLRNLSAVSDQDPTIALLDVSSITLDILSFYQQRFANEHYIGTATERYSIDQLAKSIGYKLSPGVAATGYLAFNLLDAPGSPTSVIVPESAQVQSQPKEEEAPQIFETSEAIEAKTPWNALRPLRKRWHTPSTNTRIFYLEGLTTNLRPGDPVLLVSKHPDGKTTNTLFRRIQNIDTDFERETTKVRIDKPLSPKFVGDLPEESAYQFFALRQQAAIFGYNEIKYDENEDDNKNIYLTPRPKNASERAQLSNTVQLDNAYKNISPDSWVVFKKASAKIATQIDEVKEAIAQNSMTSVKVTELHVSVDDFKGYDDGNTTVYVQSEELTIAPTPLESPVEGDSLILDTDTYDFREKHPISFAGIDPDSKELISEIAFIESIHVSNATLPDATTHPIVTVTLENSLANTYQRESLIMNANVVEATHGQSRFEILGSGDGAQSLQGFILKNTPLTYVPADNETGSASTLTVKVDDIKWEEADTHYGAAPEDSSYIVETLDTQESKIKFGDGQRGRKLPTGSNNVVANYRQGIGTSGLLDPGQLHILLTRPLGLQSATNPAATFGAEDPESTENARTNAPLKVITIDRVVSLNDFTYFARAFTGIAKATSKWIWNGNERIIHLTVASSDGTTPASSQIELLTSAIDKRRDPFQLFEVDGYAPIYFKLHGTLWVDERYDEDLVKATAIEALQAAYAFTERDFAQNVTAAEIYALLQSIEGIVGVDLDLLEHQNTESRRQSKSDPAQTRLEARSARYKDGQYLPAEILLIDAEDTDAVWFETKTATT